MGALKHMFQTIFDPEPTPPKSSEPNGNYAKPGSGNDSSYSDYYDKKRAWQKRNGQEESWRNARDYDGE